MIAPLLRSMVCPPNFSVLRRRGLGGTSMHLDGAAALAKEQLRREAPLEVVKTAAPAVNGGRRWKSPHGLRREPLRMYFYTRADNQASTLELLSKITSLQLAKIYAPILLRSPVVPVIQTAQPPASHDSSADSLRGRGKTTAGSF